MRLRIYHLFLLALMTQISTAQCSEKKHNDELEKYILEHVPRVFSKSDNVGVDDHDVLVLPLLPKRSTISISGNSASSGAGYIFAYFSFFANVANIEFEYKSPSNIVVYVDKNWHSKLRNGDANAALVENGLSDDQIREIKARVKGDAICQVFVFVADDKIVSSVLLATLIPTVICSDPHGPIRVIRLM